MLTSQDVIDEIQKQLGVPWQSQHGDGFSDGILEGSPDTAATGIVTTFTPTIEVLRRAVASGKNIVICRESPYYSRGERAPISYRNGPMPPKELTDKDPVCRAKREFIAQNKLVVIRFFDNWQARQTDGQMLALTRALGWEKYHLREKTSRDEYQPRDVYFRLPDTSLSELAEHLKQRLKIQGVRVIGNSYSKVSNVALKPGLLLVAETERILNRPGVDVIVAGDAVEWEAAPYFQDLVTAGQAKGLILLGEEASEEPGSGEVAAWLKTFITEMPIEWIPAGEPFWTLA